MVTGITEETTRKPLDEMAKALVRTQLRRLELAPSIVHLTDETIGSGVSAGDGLSFENDPAVLVAECNDAYTEIQQALTDLSPVPADIANKIAALGSVKEVQKIRALKREIKQDIKQAIEWDKVEKSLALSGLMQDAQYQALWADFHKGETAIQGAFEKLYVDCKITPEQMHYMRSERERLDGLAQDSAERIKGELALAGYQKELGIKIGDDARKIGDDETEKSAGMVVHGAREQLCLLEAMRKRSGEVAKEMKQQTAHANIHMHMNDDDTPSTASDFPKGMEVEHNVTQNDIQSPPGGKDRPMGKAVGKI